MSRSLQTRLAENSAAVSDAATYAGRVARIGWLATALSALAVAILAAGNDGGVSVPAAIAALIGTAGLGTAIGSTIAQRRNRQMLARIEALRHALAGES